MHYQLTTLDNGLRVISETMPDIRSVAVGCWVDTGTRDEQSNEAGASHFLEHLLFKGSEAMSAREISEAFDAMGAQSNAFTSKEQTCYWARLLDEDLAAGLDLLAEMLQRPAFRIDEIDSERQVVIEEINMNEDDPTDTAHEQFFQAVFQGHALERPVLGTRESVRAMSREDIHGYWKSRYNAESVVVAVAGAVDHDETVALIEDRFGDWAGGGVAHESREPDAKSRVKVVERDTEQANIVLGGIGIDRSDPDRFAAAVFNHILGGGMSSRLFQKIREEEGLAYAIYSFGMQFAETGAWGVYVGTTPGMAETAMGLIDSELEQVVSTGVSESEVTRAQGSLRGGLAISVEDANSRMTTLGRAEITGIEHLSTDERIARIGAVTAGDVHRIAQRMLGGPRSVGAAGPFSESDLAEFVR